MSDIVEREALADFVELKLLIDEFDPTNSDWNFRKGVMLDVLARLRAQLASARQALDRTLSQCPHDFGHDSNGPVGCRLNALELECVCLGIHAALAHADERGE